MPNTDVNEPPSAREAFDRTDRTALLTQAATLLVLGSQLRGTSTVEDALPQEDLIVLGIPSLPSLGGRVDSQAIRASLAARFGTSVANPIPVGEDVTWRPDIFSVLITDHLRESTALSALSLMEACIRHSHELVRVAAAAAYYDWSSEREKLRVILEQGTRSADLLVRQVAATALAQVNPDNARLTDFQRSSGHAASASGGNTSMLVHGTFALGALWWQPGGDFHSYLLKQVRSDLYKEDDRFAWSGGYSSGARADGAETLWRWVVKHNEQGLDLFTHSHGGSVAMLASNKGIQIGELVLLSCPVHIPKYQPDFERVQKIVSIRVHLDLVILADRGGQKFKHPQIRENILPIWFDHTATHNPDVWRNSTYGIPAML